MRAAPEAPAVDAVVIGSGPNGLVGANLLADAGWSVLVLEAQPTLGGAVRSDTGVHPGFVHDTFSAFYPLAAASPVIRSLRLEEHGLTWRHAPAVLGHPFPDGSWALLHRDRQVTAGLLETGSPGDGSAWLDLCAEWDRIGDHLVSALLSPFPPVRAGLGTLAALRGVGGLGFVRTLLTPVTDLGRQRFAGEAARVLLAGNAGHADIPLEAAGSSVIALLLAMLGQTVGFPVPEGGAGRLTAAMAARLESRGGEVRCDHEVTSVEVDRGRVVAVHAAGQRIRVGRAVLADVLASHLYGGLLAPDDVPWRIARGLGSFQLDPGTIKVDWAVDGTIPWASPPAHAPGTFHVADSVTQLSESLAQVAAGVVPAAPFLLAGQMTTSDLSRSPAGTESVWAYTHVPQHSSYDAGEGGVRGVWDDDDCERFADRMQDRITALAPGFESRILARRVLGPHQLQARNANLVNGALGGGTANLHQQLVFRPVPGQLGRAETGVGGLYLASSSAHPGGGVHGAPGANAARAALAHARVRRFVPGG